MKEEKLSKMLIAKPGDKHQMNKFDTSFTAGIKKEDGLKLAEKNVQSLIASQDKFYAYNKYSMLIIFQAMDAAGKDGTIKHVMSGINPQSCQVYSFKAPSAEELDHNYMWRNIKVAPERGRIGIFNRSHYEEVLVTKVHPEFILGENLPDVTKLSDVDADFWEKRYRQINDIERYWTENGTIVLKFFLHVSKDEQKKRFLDRIDDETKNWKFSSNDIKERQHWDEYMKAYSDAITHTSTENAPWYVIPADHKWFMRYAVGSIIAEKMSELKISYPKISDEAKKDLQQVKETLLKEKE